MVMFGEFIQFIKKHPGLIPEQYNHPFRREQQENHIQN